MDTSKEYIELCNKAQEIQDIKKTIGSYCCFELGDMFHRIGFEYWFDGKVKQPVIENTVWLPRQDQLQEILVEEYRGDFKYPTFAMLEDLYNQENNLFDSKDENNKTLEKAWLILLMSENYNKQWNPETKEWEKM